MPATARPVHAAAVAHRVVLVPSRRLSIAGADQFASYVAGVQEMAGEKGDSMAEPTVTVDDWDEGPKQVVMFKEILSKYPVKATENVCVNCDGRGVIVCDNCQVPARVRAAREPSCGREWAYHTRNRLGALGALARANLPSTRRRARRRARHRARRRARRCAQFCPRCCPPCRFVCACAPSRMQARARTRGLLSSWAALDRVRAPSRSRLCVLLGAGLRVPAALPGAVLARRLYGLSARGAWLERGPHSAKRIG